ncbi:MAG: TIGR02186 family protein [Alphaproteobacteria bacterium]|nr:TIGR02186 family protein [Alphaproteobacteria bacterium]MCW5743308.1 TIGR02186 family protein [Alphaproteobacteria bacterium]
MTRLVVTLLAAMLAAVTLLAAALPAAAQSLLFDLSRPRVSITSAFAGTDILVYGALDAPGDVIVTVSGAPSRQTVLRKERVMGLWVTGARQTFDDVPVYYAIAATRPLAQIMPADGVPGVSITLAERLAAIRAQGAQRRSAAELRAFERGLVEAKQRDGLYPEGVTPITVLAGRLFRAELQFPSRLPVGDYEITAYVLRDGQPVAAVSKPLIVSKAGFSADISEWARDEAPMYGGFAIAMALLVGWVTGALARRL